MVLRGMAGFPIDSKILAPVPLTKINHEGEERPRLAASAMVHGRKAAANDPAATVLTAIGVGIAVEDDFLLQPGDAAIADRWQVIALRGSAVETGLHRAVASGVGGSGAEQRSDT